MYDGSVDQGTQNGGQFDATPTAGLQNPSALGLSNAQPSVPGSTLEVFGGGSMYLPSQQSVPELQVPPAMPFTAGAQNVSGASGQSPEPLCHSDDLTAGPSASWQAQQGAGGSTLGQFVMQPSQQYPPFKQEGLPTAGAAQYVLSSQPPAGPSNAPDLNLPVDLSNAPDQTFQNRPIRQPASREVLLRVAIRLPWIQDEAFFMRLARSTLSPSELVRFLNPCEPRGVVNRHRILAGHYDLPERYHIRDTVDMFRQTFPHLTAFFHAWNEYGRFLRWLYRADSLAIDEAFAAHAASLNDLLRLYRVEAVMGYHFEVQQRRQELHRGFDPEAWRSIDVAAVCQHLPASALRPTGLAFVPDA